jgi:hypothetical protein
MLRQSLMLSLLIATANSAADDIVTDKAPPPVATEKTAAAEPAAALTAAVRPEPGKGGSKTLSGMSVLGNQEAPKALVIVPWKSSEIGDPLGLDKNLDGSRRPVDKEVFMRELDYYDIRSGSE